MRRAAAATLICASVFMVVPAAAGTFTCPVAASGAAPEGVWKLVDPAQTNVDYALMSIEVFAGPPSENFQLRPAASSADGVTQAVYDLSDVSQGYARCQYTGTDLSFEMALDAEFKSCQTSYTGDVINSQIICE